MAGPAHHVQLGAPAVAAELLPARRGPNLRRLAARHPNLVIGLVIVVAVVLVALLAPAIAPRDPSAQSLLRRLSAPGTNGYILGADDFGRDVLSRLLWGARISLLVGVSAVAIGALVGSLLGLLAGFYGGAVDALITRLLDVILTFPPMLLAIAIVAAAGSGIGIVVFAIAATSVPRFARIVRASTFGARSAEYVNAARVIGATDSRLLAGHIVPNILSPVIVVATLSIGAAILTEASLSFLGLGVGPPTPTWGGMIQSGTQQLERAPWIALSAGVAIMLTVLALNLLGDGVRDLLDPRLRER